MKQEYTAFVTEIVHGDASNLLHFQKYDKIKDDRIDCFLATHLQESQYLRLWELVKCLLVLSHSQAGVERGFSSNSEIMSYNFKEKSVVALRVIYDHIQQCGGVLNVKIDNDLRNSVKNASSRFSSELKWQQDQKKKKDKDAANKPVSDEIDSLTRKRKRLLEDCSILRDSAETLMDLAEKEQKMIHLTKVNSYRRTIKDMEKEAEDLHGKVEQLKKNAKEIIHQLFWSCGNVRFLSL